jgi:phospholipase/lecithinase/hemolysin
MRIPFWSFLAAASPANSLPRRPQPGKGLPRLRTLISFAAFAVFSCAGVLAQTNNYSTIVVFGDSLSDTGNVLHLSLHKYWIPVPGYVPLLDEDYTLGRFTDGFDTSPHARRHFGVWIEQLAAALPGHPLVFNSLDHGTNYAYGDATTANGFSTLSFGIGNASVQIENIGQQITDYLATNPHIDNHTLFVVWGGAEDLLSASSNNDVLNAAVNQICNIQRLIQAGATQFLIPNLPPLGLVPRLNGSPVNSQAANAASLLFNSYLATGIAFLKGSYPGLPLNFYQLDVFSLFVSVVTSPGSYSLTNFKDPADNLPWYANPDTYLFWDYLHPTTTGHYILASAAIDLMSQ